MALLAPYRGQTETGNADLGGETGFEAEKLLRRKLQVDVTLHTQWGDGKGHRAGTGMGPPFF